MSPIFLIKDKEIEPKTIGATKFGIMNIAAQRFPAMEKWLGKTNIAKKEHMSVDASAIIDKINAVLRLLCIL